MTEVTACVHGQFPNTASHVPISVFSVYHARGPRTSLRRLPRGAVVGVHDLPGPA